MEKSIQAIDIAAVASGNKGTPNKSAEGDETASFAEVLSPARARAAGPGDGQATGGGGNNLPGERELPASPAEPAVAEEAEQVSQLASVLAEQVPTSVIPAATIAEDLPVAKALTDAPLLNTTPGKESIINGARQPLPDANGQLPAAALTARAETATVTREAADSRDGPPAPLQQVADSRSTGAAADLPLAAVRTSVQQALAAQVAQDGLRQSLTGGDRNGKLTSGLAPTNSAEALVASFSSTLADVTSAAGSARIGVPVGEAGWGRAVGSQVIWHVSQNIQTANLRLNPQHLGPLEMQIQMEGDKATVAFTSQHGLVREALESSLPRLREMFAENGLDIVDVNVSQQDTSGRQQQDAETRGNLSGKEIEGHLSAEQSSILLPRTGEAAGMVDYYV